MAANSETKEWKERGIGMLHINKHGPSGKGRIVMRTDVTLKLILNTICAKEMKFEILQDKNIRFLGILDGNPGMFLLRLKSKDFAEEALSVIEDLFD